MPKRFLTGIDLERNQIINVALQNLAAAPANPVQGQVYYNTVSRIVFYWDGTQWIGIAGTITSVQGGAGMTGGGTTGEVTLNFNPDNITIEVAPDNTVRIRDLGVTTAKIGNLAVTSDKIANGAVTEAKIADNAVTTNKINNLAVTEAKIANNAVTTVKVTDRAITFAKIQDIATMTVIGRVAAGTGVPSAISIITDLNSASGTTLATSAAIKSYVDATLTALGNLEGGFNAATNTNFPTGATPSPGTRKGDYWYVTAAGTVQGIALDVGDVIIAIRDNASPVDSSDWIVLETNRGQATTEVLGVVSLATEAEVIAGTNNTKAVTPASLPNATTAARGLTTLATNAETQAGTVSNKAVTPAALASRTATETRTGIAAIATQAQVNAGTNDSTIVTPLKLKTFFDTAVGGFAANVGNGSATSFVLTHGLNTQDVVVQIQDNTNREYVEADVFATDANNVTVVFGSAPPANRFRVIIKK